MIRFKNANATGVATDGRWYAGDLNLFQDLVAALTDFTQNISLASIKIGENALQLLRYGAGEARLTGLLRVDGILRGLGGLYAGTFTTAQRDAIPLGSRPQWLIISNTTTGRLEYNAGTDAVPNWKPLAGVEVGTFPGRPAPGTPGRTWWDTTNLIMWVDTGTRWLALDGQIGDITYLSIPVLNLAGVQEPLPGRLLCNGAVVSRATYAELYARLGENAYAPDSVVGGVPSFTLPNALGRVLVGRSADAEFDTTGEAGGEKTHVLTVGEIPAHKHTLEDVAAPTFTGAGVPQVPSADFNPGKGIDETANAGGSGAHNNLQPYITVGAAVIKY